MILSDIEIIQAVARDEIGITPFDTKQVQPASYDMMLDRYFRTYDRRGAVDPIEPDRRTHMVEGDVFIVPSQGFVLASTVERVRFPTWCVGRLEGKSSLARMGIFIHVTAGFIDPGFEGYVTLEVFNANPNAVVLHAGMPICQMSFMRMGRAANVPYGKGKLGSKYQDQERGPQESAYYKNFEEA